VTEGTAPWRQGRSQPHNVYLDDVHRLVVLGAPDAAAFLAEQIVAALNAAPSPEE